jgi:hypothetical protein
MSNNKRKGMPKAIPGMGPGGQPLMQFSPEALKSATEMKCLNEIPIDDKPGEFMQCGGEIFVEATRLRHISKIMSPAGRETIATVNIGKLCVACGRIFNPDEWLKQNQEMEKGLEGTVLDKNKPSSILDKNGKKL